jgi:hypothetical protein
MDQIFSNIQKDVDYHCKNIDDFNKEILKFLEKTNQDAVDNLSNIVDEISKPVILFIENVGPKPYNPFRN